MTTSETLRLQKINEDSCKKLALRFFKRKQEMAKLNKDFDNLKECFYSNMAEYYDLQHIDRVKAKLTCNDGEVERTLQVTKAQRVTVNFDADKVAKALGKENAKKVVTKSYSVLDMPGLIEYAQSLGADPKEFKKFFYVSKSVDKTELDQLEELGEIKASQLEGCYEVSKGDPYFLVKEVVEEEAGDDN